MALVAALTLASVAAQLVVSGRLELSFDEAYYDLWSQHLAWGYLDHPPMVALWIRISTALFGGSDLGVRALDVVAFAASPALIGVAAARLFSAPRVGVSAALVWLATPLTAGAFLATPDAPLTLFAIVALAGLVEVWRGRAAGWAIVGLALGLALESKFTAFFLAAGVALAVAVVPSLSRWWRSPAPYVAALGAAAMFAPFVLWNATHDWETFAKQFSRVPAEAWTLRFAPEYIGATIGAANPLFVVAAGGWLARRERGPVDPEAEAKRLLIAYMAPALLYFLVHALHDRVQANWPAPVYPAFAMLAGAAAVRAPLWARRTAAAGVAFGAAVLAALYLYAAIGWPAFGAADPLARIGGWRALAAEVCARAESEGAAYVLVRDYAATAPLMVYGDGARPVIQAEDRERWTFLPPPDMSVFASPGLAFGDADRDFAEELARRFRSVEPIGRLLRRVGGVPVGAYELYRVSGPIAPVFE